MWYGIYKEAQEKPISQEDPFKESADYHKKYVRERLKVRKAYPFQNVDVSTLRLIADFIDDVCSWQNGASSPSLTTSYKALPQAFKELISRKNLSGLYRVDPVISSKGTITYKICSFSTSKNYPETLSKIYHTNPNASLLTEKNIVSCEGIIDSDKLVKWIDGNEESLCQLDETLDYSVGDDEGEVILINATLSLNTPSVNQAR